MFTYLIISYQLYTLIADYLYNNCLRMLNIILNVYICKLILYELIQLTLQIV